MHEKINRNPAAHTKESEGYMFRIRINASVPEKDTILVSQVNMAKQ